MLTDERSRVWERRLRRVVAAINRDPRRILANETPVDAVEKDKGKLRDVNYKRPVGVDEIRLPPGVKVRYLLFP